MKQLAWAPNATGNIATRSFTSVLCFENGADTIILTTPPPWTTGNVKGKGKTERGKRVTKAKTYNYYG